MFYSAVVSCCLGVVVLLECSVGGSSRRWLLAESKTCSFVSQPPSSHPPPDYSLASLHTLHNTQCTLCTLHSAPGKKGFELLHLQSVLCLMGHLANWAAGRRNWGRWDSSLQIQKMQLRWMSQVEWIGWNHWTGRGKNTNKKLYWVEDWRMLTGTSRTSGTFLLKRRNGYSTPLTRLSTRT